MFLRSLCEDLPALQQAANHEEEDSHQEENTEPRLQRVFCLRFAQNPGFQPRQYPGARQV